MALANLTTEQIKDLQPPTTQDNVIYYNNVRYKISIALYNPQGQKNSILLSIPPSNLLSLVIEEDTRNWYVKGTITLKNYANQIQRSNYEFDVVRKVGYKFRNDGRDLLFINIIPFPEESATVDAPSTIPTYAQLNYIFCVYDI